MWSHKLAFFGHKGKTVIGAGSMVWLAFNNIVLKRDNYWSASTKYSCLLYYKVLLSQTYLSCTLLTKIGSYLPFILLDKEEFKVHVVLVYTVGYWKKDLKIFLTSDLRPILCTFHLVDRLFKKECFQNLKWKSRRGAKTQQLVHHHNYDFLQREVQALKAWLTTIIYTIV